MATTYLQLCNRVLKALNEVQFTSADFASARGFHAEVKDAVNMAIVDVYTEENNEWPFGWVAVTVNTVAGQTKYTLDTSVTTMDIGSFRLEKPQVAVSSLTQASGTATCTTSTAHYLKVGDSVEIYGATPTAYNGSHVVVAVNSTTEFTFSIPSGTSSPASGTIYSYPPFSTEFLELISYDQYRQRYLARDLNTINPDEYSKPECVVRTIDNNIIVTPKPDRVYPIVYEGFKIPDALSAHDDTITIPDWAQQMIVDKALHYAYMFRDNLEEANYAEDRYRANVNKIRGILINQDEYMRFE